MECWLNFPEFSRVPALGKRGKEGKVCRKGAGELPGHPEGGKLLGVQLHILFHLIRA